MLILTGDGAGLGARSAVRLLDGHRLAGLGFPVGGEGLVIGLVELTRRIVGHVEDGGVGERETERAELDRCGDQCAEQFPEMRFGHFCLR